MVFLRILSIINETIPDYKKKNSKLTHPLFLNSISMSRLENTWLSYRPIDFIAKKREGHVSVQPLKNQFM